MHRLSGKRGKVKSNVQRMSLIGDLERSAIGMRSYLVICGWAMFAGGNIIGESTTVTVSGPRTVHISFRTGPDGKAYIPATINGQRASLLIDTGGCTILDLQFARKLGLDLRPATYAPVSISGQTANPCYVATADVKLGELTIGGMPIGCMDISAMQRLNTVSNRPDFQGTIGSDLLALLRAKVDYDKERLTVRRPKK